MTILYGKTSSHQVIEGGRRDFNNDVAPFYNHTYNTPLFFFSNIVIIYIVVMDEARNWVRNYSCNWEKNIIEHVSVALKVWGYITSQL